MLLTGDRVEGPFTYAGTVVYGGFTPANWQETDVARVLHVTELPERYVRFGVANRQWGPMFPNCIDPCVFEDADGKLWMSYGSWSGGIFLLALEPPHLALLGLPLPEFGSFLRGRPLLVHVSLPVPCLRGIGLVFSFAIVS